MTTRVLIVDPDIAFAVPIKHALEQSGDFAVSVFANGRAALEAVQRESYSVAILDFAVADMDLPTLIRELRQIAVGLFILASPRTSEHITRLPTLDVQGSITKPYFARQLIPVIRTAITAKAQLARKEHERRLDAAEAAESTPARQASRIVEPPIQPDDTFKRLVSEDTGKSRAVQAENAEPPIPEHATIGELVSGQPIITAQPVQSDAEPEAAPDLPVEADADLAAAALGAAEDDTVPLDLASVQALLARDEPRDAAGMLPPWVRQTDADADQPTLVEPTPHYEDTQPSSHIVIPRFAPPAGDTEPGGGIVQQKLEAERRTDEPSVFPEQPESEVEPVVEPEQPPVEQPVPPMLEEPSFVARVVEEPLPTAFAAPPPSAEPESPPMPALGDPAATLAVQLTQLSVESTAQITLLTRDGELLASAGQMSPVAVAGVVVTISQAWQGATDDGNALVRFVNIPGVGDYLLYSTRTVESMMLSMLFSADTPLRIIRQQARNLIKALESVPEHPAFPAEPLAATTLPSRPTDLRPPEGLAEAYSPQEEEAPAAAGSAAPPLVEGPFAAYAFVWLPREAVIPEPVSSMLVDWINAIAAAHGWQIDGVEFQPTYVTVQISIPANETPTTAVETLMRESAGRAGDAALWADAYYIVSPGRAVTQQEIANFMEYRRDVQDAA